MKWISSNATRILQLVGVSAFKVLKEGWKLNELNWTRESHNLEPTKPYFAFILKKTLKQNFEH